MTMPSGQIIKGTWPELGMNPGGTKPRRITTNKAAEIRRRWRRAILDIPEGVMVLKEARKL